MLFFILVDTRPMTKAEYLQQQGKLALFSYAGMGTLSEAEQKMIYMKACTKKCHSNDVVERSAHTAREWENTINRMRTANNARVTDNEAVAITAYLSRRYGSNIPTVLSAEGGKYLKTYLWRSDFGESDLYVDIIYTPEEYFDIVGGSMEVEGYDAANYLLFKVYLNTHQNKLDTFPLDELTVINGGDGKEFKPLLWKVIYESSDFHHREGLLVFDKLKKETAPLEMALRDLPGQKERLFQWALPIPKNY